MQATERWTLLLGFALLVLAIIMGEVVVFRMARAWNRIHTGHDRISLLMVLLPGAALNTPVKKYLQQYGKGPLWLQMKIVYCFLGSGFTLVLTSLLIGKMAGI